MDVVAGTGAWTPCHGGFPPVDDGDLSLADSRGVVVSEAISRLLRGELTFEYALYLDGPGERKAKEPFSLALRSGLKTEELLLEQLLDSFDSRWGDPELMQWEKGKTPDNPFFLFKMKASAKNAQVSWWKKKYARFSPERKGYTAALRVARLGADGIHLEQAGEGGRPGALSYDVDWEYMKLGLPKGPFLEEGSDTPVREVAVIRRLPAGDGISVTSRINGLGVQLGDILFLLPCSAATVALTFTERSFYVSSQFTEEPLYARVGLDFINITDPVENLIRKLYGLYEQEEQDKKAKQEQQNQDDHVDMEELVRRKEEQERERVELMRQRKEQEREKMEFLQRRRAESKKCKCLRKEVKKMIGKVKPGPRPDEEHVQDGEYAEEGSLFPLLFPCPEESDCKKPLKISSPNESDCESPLGFPSPGESDCEMPLELELCRNEEIHIEFLEGVVKPRVQNDLVNLGGGSGWKIWVTENPLAA